MGETIRWGILGTGYIAGAFAKDLKRASGAELIAVGSRARKTADAFGDEFGVPRRHSRYEALAEDPHVEAVYVATPHHLHCANTLMCLNAGKAVLCEKPFAINAREAREMVATARERELFLMEAMWTRFFPAMDKVRALLDDGAIGDVRMVTGDFGFRAAGDERGRLVDPAAGGGPPLDVGVYPVSLASMVLGAPSRIAALAHLGETGVDEQAGILLGHDAGQLAILHSAVETETPQEAAILGTEGRIRIAPRFWCPSRLVISREGKDDEALEFPYEGQGYQFEADEVMTCLREGRAESALMPLDESVEVMETLDRIRAEWGLRYPMD